MLDINFDQASGIKPIYDKQIVNDCKYCYKYIKWLENFSETNNKLSKKFINKISIDVLLFITIYNHKSGVELLVKKILQKKVEENTLNLCALFIASDMNLGLDLLEMYQIKILKMLVKKGASLYVSDTNGTTAYIQLKNICNNLMWTDKRLKKINRVLLLSFVHKEVI